MKVWIVNPFDNLPLEGNRPQRYWLLSRALMRRGHEVTYWTADFSHARKRKRIFTAANPDPEMKLELVHEPAYRKNVGLKRIYAHWRLARNWQAAVENAAPPDLVIVSSPPLLLAAAAREYCRRMSVKMIVDVQDAWPETFYRVLPAWLLAPLKRLARRNYLAADGISAVSRRYVELVRAYGATCPTYRCYHGIERPAPVCPVPAKEGAAFRLVYLGNMSLSYDLATVIDAVKNLPEVELDLAGTGPDEPALREQAQGCARIHFHGYLGEAEMFALSARSDAGIIAMFPASEVGIPGKLADYLAAGLPVINSLKGETAELLGRSGAGEDYEAGRLKSLEKVLGRWAALRRQAPDEWQARRRAARILAAAFDAPRLYDGYSDFVEQIMAG